MPGWVEAGEDLPLAQEAAQDLLGVHAALEQLERHRLLELPVAPARRPRPRPCRRGRAGRSAARGRSRPATSGAVAAPSQSATSSRAATPAGASRRPPAPASAASSSVDPGGELGVARRHAGQAVARAPPARARPAPRTARARREASAPASLTAAAPAADSSAQQEGARQPPVALDRAIGHAHAARRSPRPRGRRRSATRRAGRASGVDRLEPVQRAVEGDQLLAAGGDRELVVVERERRPRVRPASGACAGGRGRPAPGASPARSARRSGSGRGSTRARRPRA